MAEPLLLQDYRAHLQLKIASRFALHGSRSASRYISRQALHPSGFVQADDFEAFQGAVHQFALGHALDRWTPDFLLAGQHYLNELRNDSRLTLHGVDRIEPRPESRRADSILRQFESLDVEYVAEPEVQLLGLTVNLAEDRSGVNLREVAEYRDPKSVCWLDPARITLSLDTQTLLDQFPDQALRLLTLRRASGTSLTSTTLRSQESHAGASPPS